MRKEMKSEVGKKGKANRKEMMNPEHVGNSRKDILKFFGAFYFYVSYD